MSEKQTVKQVEKVRKVRSWKIERWSEESKAWVPAGPPSTPSSVEAERVMRKLLKGDQSEMLRAVKVIGPVKAEKVEKIRVTGF